MTHLVFQFVFESLRVLQLGLVSLGARQDWRNGVPEGHSCRRVHVELTILWINVNGKLNLHTCMC